MLVQALIGLGIALAFVMVVIVAILLTLRAPAQSIGEIAWIIPSALRLAVSLYRDQSVPNSVRWRLRFAVVYNVQPINLIPDFIPVVGFVDNALVLAWALRSAARVAGPGALERHWKGSPAALALLTRTLRLPMPSLVFADPGHGLTEGSRDIEQG